MTEPRPRIKITDPDRLILVSVLALSVLDTFLLIFT